MRTTLILSSVAAVGLIYGASTSIVTAQQQEQQQDGQEVAQQCLEELQQTAQALAEEGYWITGWGQRWGWGWTSPRPGVTEPGAPAVTGTAPPPEADGDVPADAPQPPTMARDPWGFGTMAGVASPRHQVRTLYSAAHVLAYQGDQEGCEYVKARLEQTAEGHLEELRDMGVAADEIVDWRQESLAGAVPVTDLDPAGIFIDDLTGADVRNLQDEYLGSVADIVLDVDEREPEYVIIARGGFLGIGEDHVLVPWEELSAVPQLNLLVLDVQETAFEEAPAVDPDFAMETEWMDEYRQQTDAYWEERS